MAYMIEISESKADKLKEHAYKSMKHLGKLYECIEELCEDSSMGERGGNYGNRYGNRYGGGGSYGNRMGYREEEDFEEEDFGERRGVRGTGRYSRFR